MNTKWAGDMTGIETAQGWLYLAVILDVYSRKVIGWSMSGSRDETLVENALLMALSSRKPTAGLLLHSDRGSQYTSHRYQELLKQYKIEASEQERQLLG
jgi:putative transposase